MGSLLRYNVDLFELNCRAFSLMPTTLYPSLVTIPVSIEVAHTVNPFTVSSTVSTVYIALIVRNSTCIFDTFSTYTMNMCMYCTVSYIYSIYSISGHMRKVVSCRIHAALINRIKR